MTALGDKTTEGSVKGEDGVKRVRRKRSSSDGVCSFLSVKNDQTARPAQP